MSNIREQYKYVTDKDDKWTCIGITGGKYDGVVYKYGEVNLVEEKDSDQMRLQFEWDIVDSNGLPKEMLGEDFFSLIGDVLVDILEEQLQNGELEYNESDD